jgi:hypothetical protein
MLWVSTKETYFNLAPDQLLKNLERLKGICAMMNETPSVEVGAENHQNSILLHAPQRCLGHTLEEGRRWVVE